MIHLFNIMFDYTSVTVLLSDYKENAWDCKMSKIKSLTLKISND